MVEAKSTLVPPEVIAGRYKIESKLGEGGMGSVWRAQHLSLRSPVAIKLIDPSLADSSDAVARFLREAQAAASLRSPHVVQILDHGVDHNLPYIAMELLEGESLAERLARTQKLSPADTSRVMTHVARAMGLAHAAGIVHRDLKPDNVFLVRNDDEEIAKVLDFGVAKATTAPFDVTTATRTGAMLGTPYYMSPEQVEGSKDIDHRADLWAMAVIAFECLTGVRPFDSDTLGALLLQICSKPIPVPSEVAEVPAGFDAWFARATKRLPAERFSSAREMADALRAVLIPNTAARRGRTMPIAVGCAVLLAIVALLLSRSSGEKPQSHQEHPRVVRPAHQPIAQTPAAMPPAPIVPTEEIAHPVSAKSQPAVSTKAPLRASPGRRSSAERRKPARPSPTDLGF